MSHHHRDDEPYIVIEKHSGDVSSLLVGVLIGAGIALLFAPRSGMETRADIAHRARRASDKVKNVADEVTGQVVDTFEGARARVEEQIDSARYAIESKKRQVSRAMAAGRQAAAQARGDLERRIAETKAAYHAGAEVATSDRSAVRRAPDGHTDTAV